MPMRPRYVRLLFLALVAVVYLPVVQQGFASDDVGLVLNNPQTATLSRIPELFRNPLWAGVDAQEASYFRPVMLVSLAVDRAIAGLSAPLHHLHSLGWHLAAVGALVALLERRFGLERAIIGSLVFALHPVQTEAVTFISSRNELMAAALGLAGVLVLDAPLLGAGSVLCGALLLLAAMCSKETAVLAAAAWVALDGASTSPRGARRILAVGLAIAGFAALRVNAVGLGVPGGSGGLAALAPRLPEVIGYYGRLLAWPWPLSDSVTLVYMAASPIQTLLGWLIIAACAFALTLRGGREAGVALLFAVIAAAPPIFAIASKQLLADRYLYLPLVGVAHAVARAVPAGVLARATAALLLVPSIVLINMRIPDWESSLTLAESSAETTPSPYSWGWLGIELANEGRNAEALPWLERALSGPTPFCPAAPHAVRAALAAPPTAVRLGQLAFDGGCGGVPEFREIWALANALDGDLGRADSILTPRPGRCTQGTVLMLAALHVQEGDDAAARACAVEAGVDAGGIVEAAAALLRRAGAGEDVAPPAADQQPSDHLEADHG